MSDNIIQLNEAAIKGELKDPAVFNNPVIEHGVLTWKNGEIDCAPEYLYDHSYEYSNTMVV